MDIDGQIIELSHLDKLFYPRDGITKGDVIQYYKAIASVMLPFVAHRCISMQRFPDGIDGASFYHKDIPGYFPDFVDRYQVPLVGKSDKKFNTLVVCNSKVALVYLANQDCLTLHAWLSSAPDIHRPDKIIFDLDPEDGSFAKVIEVSLALKAILRSRGMLPFIMLTGSRGVHVVVPIVAEAEFATVRDFVQKIAAEVVQKLPTIATIAVHKRDRGAAVFIDTARNSYGQTAVAPYALRAKDGAPVAMPIEWEELESSGMHASFFSLSKSIERMKSNMLAWSNFNQSAINLSKIF